MADRELKIKVTTDTSAARQGVNMLRGSFTELASVLGLARQAAQAIGQVYQATVGQLMTYAGQVRDLSIVTGQNATETSRLIQVMDDFEITTGDLQMAARRLREQGLSPNIETLSGLSDQFRRIQDPAARASFLFDNFGRAGENFALAMDQGGDALRAMGEEVNASLLLTDQQIAQTEELRLATDELNDSWNGITTTIGMRAVPALAQMATALDDLLNKEANLSFFSGEVINAIFGLGTHIENAIQPTRDEAFAIRDIEAAAMGAIPQVDGLRLSTIEAAIQAAIAGEQTRGWAAAIASLQDRHITITTSLVEATAQWQQAQGHVTTSAWHPYTPTVGTSGMRSLDQQASGGQLGRNWSLVGEAGPELISPWGEVIPASRSMSMLRGGLIPRHKFMYGAGEQGGYIPPVTTGKPTLRSAMEILGWGSETRGGGKIDTGGGGGGVAVPSPIIQTIVEQVQQASAQQSAVVAATIPAAAAAAASDQTQALVAETSRSNENLMGEVRAMRREIAKLNRTFPVAVRDAVERIL